MNAVWYLCYIIGAWLGCTLYFMLVQKPLFLYNNFSKKKLSYSSALKQIEKHGCKSDFIIASYIVLPLVIPTLFGGVYPGKWFKIVTGTYWALLSVMIGLLTTADVKLYKFWGFKIDVSVLHYLRSLKGATASVSRSYIAGWLLEWLLLTLVAFGFTAGLTYPLLIQVGKDITSAGNVLSIIECVLLLLVMVLIIRGLKPLPNNPSIVYFSTNQFLNHAALNPAYSLIYSMRTRDVYKKGFNFISEEESERICNNIFYLDKEESKKILNTERPNILMIIWESANASIAESKGEEKPIAPNLSRLMEKGYNFTKCYASSFRTERAIPSILGAIPGQPTDSIIRHTRKLNKLPGLPEALKKAGYETAIIHGGDLSIVHKNDYYMSAGCDRLIQQKDFTSNLPKGKWGVHDDAVLDRVYDEVKQLGKEKKSWFMVVQTLSSHEPFEVPDEIIPGNHVKNSFAYTDEHIGKLIDRLKNTPEWKNLLVVIVGDHGVNKTTEEMSTIDHAHIPLLFTGGAVKNSGKFEKVISQTDIVATLLSQLGLMHNEFPFSRDVLSKSYRSPLAYHSFANGFMIVDEEGYTVCDLISNKVIEGSGNTQRIKTGKAILKKLYNYLAHIDKK